MITARRMIENALLGIEMRQMDLIQERAELNQMLEEMDQRKPVGRPKKQPAVNGAAQKPKRVVSPEGKQRMKEAQQRRWAKVAAQPKAKE